MAEELDVYRDWLGITTKRRPLNYYELLRVKVFEDDPEKIRKHYRKMNAHVRKYAVGEYAKQSQALLNELAQAMLCLTDARRKAEYDASLGREDAEAAGLRPFEELLLKRQVLDSEKLDKARKYAESVGVELRDAVLQQKLAAPENVQQAYAESLGLPFVELKEMELQGPLIVSLPARFCRQHFVVPLLKDEEQFVVASPKPLSPQAEDELRLRTERTVRTAICTTSAANDVIEEHYTRDTADAELRSGRHLSMGSGASAKAMSKATKAKKSSGGGGKQLSDEDKKKVRMAAGLLGFTVVMVGWQLTGGGMLVGAALAAVVGGVAFGVAVAATS